MFAVFITWIETAVSLLADNLTFNSTPPVALAVNPNKDASTSYVPAGKL